MKNYRNVLAVLDAGEININALEKTLLLAKLDEDVRVTVLLPVFDFSRELGSIMSFPEKEEMLSRIVDAREAELEQAIKDQGISGDQVTVKVIWTRSAGSAIGAELKNGSYDLILKTFSENGTLDMITGSEDRRLLRKAQIPVILVKGEQWQKGSPILVALNFTELGFCNRVNRKLLREAQILCRLSGCEIHLVYAVNFPIINTYIDVPGYLPSTYSEAVRNDCNAKLKRYADDHRIPHENIHLLTGSPDDVIPETANSLKAAAVLLGSMGRDGFSGAMIGNTAERIMDDLQCDVIVIRTPEDLLDPSKLDDDD